LSTTVVIECQANLQLEVSENNIFPIQPWVCGHKAKIFVQRCFSGTDGSPSGFWVRLWSLFYEKNRQISVWSCSPTLPCICLEWLSFYHDNFICTVGLYRFRQHLSTLLEQMSRRPLSFPASRRYAIAAERLVVFLILALIVGYCNHCLILSNLLLTPPLDAIYLVTASQDKKVPTVLSISNHTTR